MYIKIYAHFLKIVDYNTEHLLPYDSPIMLLDIYLMEMKVMVTQKSAYRCL